MNEMGGPSGIGDSSFKPPLGEVEGQKGGPSGSDIEKALHTKVRTLGQLKAMLEKDLGKKDGDKLYNVFMKSFLMMMLTQIQQSAEGAKKAAQNMRMDRQG